MTDEHQPSLSERPLLRALEQGSLQTVTQEQEIKIAYQLAHNQQWPD